MKDENGNIIISSYGRINIPEQMLKDAIKDSLITGMHTKPIVGLESYNKVIDSFVNTKINDIKKILYCKECGFLNNKYGCSNRNCLKYEDEDTLDEYYNHEKKLKELEESDEVIYHKMKLKNENEKNENEK